MTDISRKKTHMKIGQEIKKLRLDKGLTQEELADRTNLSVRTIQRIENGDVDPRAYTLQTIASALEIEFEVLNNIRDDEYDPVIARQRDFWLPMLHLSGLFVFLFPPIIIWLSKKDTIEEIKEALSTDVKFIVGSDAHAPEDVGNFTTSLERCIAAKIPVERIINAEQEGD